MTPETFLTILKQIKPYTDYIYLHVKGEPLLHPQLDELLDISNNEGFQVNITTNGTLIENVKQMLLTKSAIRQINFSLHDEYDDKFIKSILAFTKEAVINTKMFIALRLWNLHENSQGQNSRTNEGILEQIEREFELSYNIKETVGANKGIKITDRVYVNQDHQFKWPDLNETEKNCNGFCYGLRSHAAILVDGTVVPCCLDGEGIIILGNIHKEHFGEIVDSNRAKNIFNGFSRKEAVEELCQKCGYMKRFK